jgi:hypothetical protein
LLEVWSHESVGLERPSSPQTNATFAIPATTTSVAYAGVPGGRYTFFPVNSAGIRLVAGTYWLVVHTTGGFPAHYTASRPFSDQDPVVVDYQAVVEQVAGVWGTVGTPGTTLVQFDGCIVEPGEICASELSMFTLPSLLLTATNTLMAQKFYTHSSTRLLSASIALGGLSTSFPNHAQLLRYTHDTRPHAR